MRAHSPPQGDGWTFHALLARAILALAGYLGNPPLALHGRRRHNAIALLRANI